MQMSKRRRATFTLNSSTTSTIDSTINVTSSAFVIHDKGHLHQCRGVFVLHSHAQTAMKKMRWEQYTGAACY